MSDDNSKGTVQNGQNGTESAAETKSGTEEPRSD